MKFRIISKGLIVALSAVSVLLCLLSLQDNLPTDTEGIERFCHYVSCYLTVCVPGLMLLTLFQPPMRHTFFRLSLAAFILINVNLIAMALIDLSDSDWMQRLFGSEAGTAYCKTLPYFMIYFAVQIVLVLVILLHVNQPPVKHTTIGISCAWLALVFTAWFVYAVLQIPFRVVLNAGNGNTYAQILLSQYNKFYVPLFYYLLPFYPAVFLYLMMCHKTVPAAEQ